MSKERSLFLIHWNPEEAEQRAAPLRAAGWKVATEAEDGARAGRRILAQPPVVVVISLSRLPSHGRQTAQYLRSTAIGKSLPILFVDGAEDKRAGVQARVPDALFTTSEELGQALAAFAAGA